MKTGRWLILKLPAEKDLHDGHYLAFDLRDILTALGPRVGKSQWRCDVEECISIEGIEYLEEKYNVSTPIPGKTLIELANITRRMIDGTFQAFDSNADLPWVIIEAIDSSYWEVRTDDQAALESLRKKFHDIEPLD
jgi:hypothetical protein